MLRSFVQSRHAASKRGFVLAVTLLLGLVLAVTSSVGLIVTRAGSISQRNFKQSLMAFEAADSGLERAKREMKTWLTAQQAGNQVAYFSTLLSSANSNSGYLNVNGANFRDVVFGDGTTYSVKIENNATDTAQGNTSALVDEDRIVRLIATAVGAAGNTVTIESYVQSPAAPEHGGSAAFPLPTAGAVMCGDYKKQTIRMSGDSIISGYNRASLPSWDCSGSDCLIPPTSIAADPSNMYGLRFTDATKQKYNLSNHATIEGKPTGVFVDSSMHCTDYINFANQIAQLSDSLPNVQILSGEQIATGTFLGDPTTPMVTILSDFDRRVVIKKDNKGAGILMLHADTEDEVTNLVANKRFFFEGLVIVYGNAKTKFFAKKDTNIVGGLVVLTEDDPDEPDNDKGKIRMQDDSSIVLSTAGLRLAYRAIGNSLETLAEPPSNEVMTISWREQY